MRLKDAASCFFDWQREVRHFLAEGLSMKETAKILDITPRTVAFHKYRMMKQLRLKTSVELIEFAIKEGIASL
jgi:DNA-binding CsgD family transcriptional regulator